MDKIHNLNQFNDFLPLKKKKKSDKSKHKKIIGKKADSFEEILETEEIKAKKEILEKKEERLDELLKDIGKLGEKIKKTRLLKDLNTYKSYVKEYLTIFLEMAETAEKITLWDKYKKEKIAKVHLQIVNKELAELTRYFFAEQQNTFAIAAKIDKIEGILVDLKS